MGSVQIDTKQAREEAEAALATHQRWLGNWRFRLSQCRDDEAATSDADQNQQSSGETDQQSTETEKSTETND